MTTTTKTAILPTAASKLLPGDIIIRPNASDDSTVTGPVRRLGGTGLVAIPLARRGENWDGRLAASDRLTVRREVESISFVVPVRSGISS